jgi:imidazolonepropionase-like amidohydrolase
VGVVEAGRLADLIILKRDPLADIRVLQGGQHLAMVIKDGHIVTLDGDEETEDTLAYATSAQA